jgi:hypothetical protein
LSARDTNRADQASPMPRITSMEKSRYRLKNGRSAVGSIGLVKCQRWSSLVAVSRPCRTTDEARW